jgi:hypothetical protein
MRDPEVTSFTHEQPQPWAVHFAIIVGPRALSQHEATLKSNGPRGPPLEIMRAP